MRFFAPHCASGVARMKCFPHLPHYLKKGKAEKGNLTDWIIE